MTIIKNYELFKESNSKIEVGSNTNKGKVLWMDNPYNNSDGTPADISVKTDTPSRSQSFSWHKLSELELVEEPKMIEQKPDEPTEVSNLKDEIDFSDLMKIDIRVCKVTKAEKVTGKDRLLLLHIDTGLDERQVVTNIGNVYKPEDLLNKNFAFVLNLKPAKIARIDSYAMIIATEVDDKPQIIEMKVPIGSKLI